MSDEIVIYHNPNCSTSRKALAALREAGHAPRVVEYLKVGWTRPLLDELLRRMGAKPSDILRVRNTEAEALGLTAPGVGDDKILDAMTADPALVERPIVVSPKGVVLCRPLERLQTIL